MAMRLDQLRNADLNLLVYFVVLVEERSISRAAKRLRLTQSALSRVLQRLRALFQDELLVRLNGQFSPTPRGQYVLRELASILPNIDKLISGKEFDPAAEETKFRITAADSLCHLYSPLIAKRQAKTPNLSFTFSPYSEDRYAALEANSRDLVLDAEFKVLPPHLQTEILFEDVVVCAVAKNSPLKKRLSMAEYLAGRHVAVNILDERQPTLDNPLAQAGERRSCPITVPYFGVALRMIADSQLIATVPRRMGELLVDRKTVRLVEAPKEVPPFRYIMVWHQRQGNDPQHIWLRETMRELTAELFGKTSR